MHSPTKPKDLVLSPGVVLSPGTLYFVRGIKGGIARFVGHSAHEWGGLRSRKTHSYTFRNVTTNRDFTLKSKAKIQGPCGRAQ